MMSVTAYIGLGSNLGDPAANLHSAVDQIAALDTVELRAVSRFYASKPMGPQDQPDYVNAVICVRTSLDAHALLQALFAVERAHGRVRDVSLRWGPRTLDLDLLLYGAEVIETADLHVPHPGIYERSFVLLPLADITPNFLFPNGQSLHDCLQTLPCGDLHPLA